MEQEQHGGHLILIDGMSNLDLRDRRSYSATLVHLIPMGNGSFLMQPWRDPDEPLIVDATSAGSTGQPA